MACNINCDEQYACTNTKIYSDPDVGTESMTIVCNAESACSNAEMYIHNVSEFKLVCNTAQACDELTVNINGSNDRSEIYCQALSKQPNIILQCNMILNMFT